MIQDINLYEKKVIMDKEFPAQLFQNYITKKGVYFDAHWHEHVEMHYILEGKGKFYCNQSQYIASKGTLIIINGNELHEGTCIEPNMDSLVLIFDIESFSSEVKDRRMLFHSMIQGDSKLESLFLALFEEEKKRQIGYKIAMKGKIYELISYLMRYYVVESLTERENTKRNRELNRLNVVLQYMGQFYMNPITNQELAKLINLSEYRFCHLFKEVMEESPTVYLNKIRLKKAYHLLKKGNLTIAEVSDAVGFSDYNNFGRQFRRFYGAAPSKIREK